MLRTPLGPLAILALSACGPAPVVYLDVGPPPDAPILPPDAGPPPPPFACDGEVHVVNGVIGETASLTFDTSMTTDRPRDLGLHCGNTSTTAMWAGQEVIEYHVPGTGPVGVLFDTALAGTAANFNTLVQVRETCGEVPESAYPPNCFDDVGDEPRASGGFTAMGGDVVHLIVTAFSDPDAIEMEVDEGPLEISLTPSANTPPTIETASVFLVGDAMLVDATATDAEGPIFAYAISLFNADGQIDFDGDGVDEPEDSLFFEWDSVTGTSPYAGAHDITPTDDGYRLADFCREAGCTQAGIVVFDEAYSGSAVLMVPVAESPIVGPGGTCDRQHICGGGSVCTTGTCVLTPAAAAVCDGATPITIAMPTDATPVVASVTGTVPAGTGQFFGSCTNGNGGAAAATPGREQVFSIELTGTGPYDLAVTTARPGTATRDTVLYVRAVCGDASMELGCTDDNPAPMASLQSTVTLTDLEPGTYFVFVEMFGTGTGAFELQATLSL